MAVVQQNASMCNAAHPFQAVHPWGWHLAGSWWGGHRKPSAGKDITQEDISAGMSLGLERIEGRVS